MIESLFRNFRTERYSDNEQLTKSALSRNQLRSIREELRQEISQVTLELEKEIQKLNDRIGAIEEYTRMSTKM